MKRQRSRPRLTLPTLSILILVIAGCGGGEDGPALHLVTGKVVVDGRPAAKARVTFHRSGGPSNHPSPFAETDADGSFAPSTRLTKDGAPAGDYTLTIVWPEVRVDHGEEISGPDRLGGRYANPATSSLKVTVMDGENSLPPFELKSSSQSPSRSSRSDDRGR